MFQSLENRSLKSSNRWKFFAVLFPMLGSLAMAQGPGGQAGFFQAWWGVESRVLDPRTIPDLIFWVDAANASTITLNGDKVSAITDLSTNAYSITQTNAAAQPDYIISARNSKNGMRFYNGSNQFFNVSSITVPASFTSFFVFTRPVAGRHSISLASSASASPYPIWWFTDNRLYTHSGTSETQFTPTNTNTGAFYSTIRKISTITVGARLNGLDFDSKTPTASTSSWITLGRRQNSYTSGDFYEVITYSRALSDDEINRIEAYLAKKWGI
jgi:hypothetical protein